MSQYELAQVLQVCNSYAMSQYEIGTNLATSQKRTYHIKTCLVNKSQYGTPHKHTTQNDTIDTNSTKRKVYGIFFD